MVASLKQNSVHSPQRRVSGKTSGSAKFQPTWLCSALMLPALKVGAEPMRPEASRPCIGVEHAQSKDTPLLCAPCRVEPKRLTEHTKYTRPTPPAFAFVLRKPDRDDAAKGDADLI